uniref:von Willebrand factor type A domain-containing protein n=1 Tax=Candidatus Kentrum sp. TC TaxID=2126339 RepID=A0A450Y946_9GAMM|nr:MAG: von Willebrand factor type A domain-containing protein [Candidatus Kentron sp. TC]VFK38982.1 MAG: von Willebrand factor type A domain-containing protein [Candidatus Kentron sp. TC]VFK54612.1 MAG: von Willebrand factor type A domain-containing protein [Candidatus Kentron sp. TC]
MRLPFIREIASTALLALISSFAFQQVSAQDTIPGYGFAAGGGYGMKIFKVESGLYPFVQVYFRTFDQNQMPLVNLTPLNVGVMVKGRVYDPTKGQYTVDSLLQRQEAIRTVMVIDASASMMGEPFDQARLAIGGFLESKRPQDEVAVLAVRDTEDGFRMVSNFERDGKALARRLANANATGKSSRIYDTIGAAIQMCGLSSQGSVSPSPKNYIVSCSIVVFSDGYDQGSAISRGELNGRITAMEIPIPIYSLAYSRLNKKHFRNLEALSKNSFGKYYTVGETASRMQNILEEIQHILQTDYVVTFRAYEKVDGEEHIFKVGLDYPVRSGKYRFEKGRFEAIQLPPVTEELKNLYKALNSRIPALDGGNPYYEYEIPNPVSR